MWKSPHRISFHYSHWFVTRIIVSSSSRSVLLSILYQTLTLILPTKCLYLYFIKNVSILSWGINKDDSLGKHCQVCWTEGPQSAISYCSLNWGNIWVWRFFGGFKIHKYNNVSCSVTVHLSIHNIYMYCTGSPKIIYKICTWHDNFSWNWCTVLLYNHVNQSVLSLNSVMSQNLPRTHTF